MPAILPPGRVGAWLDDEWPSAQRLLATAPTGLLNATAISTRGTCEPRSDLRGNRLGRWRNTSTKITTPSVSINSWVIARSGAPWISKSAAMP